MPDRRNLSERRSTASEDTGLIAVDLWGIGAIAYDLVMGRPPWATTGEREAWEIAAAAEHPPSLDGAPPRLRRILERALALDPEHRYPSAVAMVRDLDALLRERPTSFDRTIPRRAMFWIRRHRALVVASVLAAVFASWTAISTTEVAELRASRMATSEAVLAATGHALVLELHVGGVRNAHEPASPARAIHTKAVPRHPAGLRRPAPLAPVSEPVVGTGTEPRDSREDRASVGVAQ